MTDPTIPTRRVLPAWARESLRVLAGLLVFVVLILLLKDHVRTLEAWLLDLGPWAPVVFVLAHVVLVSLGFPVSVLGFVAGATWGLTTATGLLLVAGLAAASLMFFISRRLLGHRVLAMAASRPRFARFLALAEDDSWRIMVLLRLSPLHYAVVCYLLGAGRVRFWPYFITSACVLPSAILQAYLGVATRRVGGQAASGEGLQTMETVLAVVGVTAAVTLLVVMGRLTRRALLEGAEPRS